MIEWNKYTKEILGNLPPYDNRRTENVFIDNRKNKLLNPTGNDWNIRPSMTPNIRSNINYLMVS